MPQSPLRFRPNLRKLIKLVAFSATLVVCLVYATLFALQYQFPQQSLTWMQPQQPQQQQPADDSSSGIGQLVGRILRDKLDALPKQIESRFSESISNSKARCEAMRGEGAEREEVERAIGCVIEVLEDAREFFSRQDARKYEDKELVLQISLMLKDVEIGRKPPAAWTEHELYRLNVHEKIDNETLHTWQVYQNGISKQGLYLSRDSPVIDKLLKDLAHLPIVDVEEIPEDGTQIKFVLHLGDGSKALFKPMRVARNDYETLDIYYMYEKERHTAEIAAFHLNRILGFNNVPPVAGRIVDIKKDLYEHLSDETKDQFFFSPVDNLCFYAYCDYFCTAAHAVCGIGTLLEGSMAAFNPDEGPDENLNNFWQRSYSKFNKSDWELVDDGGERFCADARAQSPYNRDRTMLNVVDTVIFDFLIGNKDRHHFYTFERYSNNSALVLYDNGKGFGRAYDDIRDILAPLYHCCVIRFTTLRLLLHLHTSPRPLSARLRQSLLSDALPHILTEAHLRAVDRRVGVVLETVLTCLRDRPGRQIVIDDQYYYERG